MGRLLYHGENLNSVPNDANLVKMNDGTNVEDSIESVKNAFTDIVSDAYSSTKTYSVDDLCIYNNKLWKCKVACSGQNPSEGTYWTQTKISDLDNEVKIYRSSYTTSSISGNTTTNITLPLPSSYNEILDVIVRGYDPNQGWTSSLIIKSTNLDGTCSVHVTGSLAQTYAVRYTVIYR